MTEKNNIGIVIASEMVCGEALQFISGNYCAYKFSNEIALSKYK